MPQPILIVLMILIIISVPTLSFAQSADTHSYYNPVLADRFTFRAGAFFGQLDSAVAKTSKSNPTRNRTIDLEDLGMDDDEVSAYLNGRWRISERWQLGFGYYGIDRDGNRSIAGEIDFGDITVPVGASVNSGFNTDLYIVTAGYSFIRDERAELGARLGVHVADLEVSLGASVNAGNQTINLGTSSADTLAPLINLGFYGTYAFTPELSITGDLGYFSLNYDKYDGEITVATGALEYRAFEHVGIGVGYSFIDTNLDVDEDRSNDRYEFEFKGPIVYLSAGF
jgi:hypothetical protein